ncbi:hypothetical protein ACLB1M_15580 [Escherichia coli]
MCACFCLAKMIRCLRNSLVVWKLPARIWSLKKLHVFATKFRRCDASPKRFVSNTGDDLDVIGVAFDAGMALLPTYCSFVRAKCSAAAAISRKMPGGTELSEVVETFVGQFYLQGSQMRTLPGEILLDFNLSDKTLLADSLSELAGRKVIFKPNLAAIGRVI